MGTDDATAPLTEFMGGGESILVVDDVKEQRDLAGRILTKLNYRVAMVESGEEAVEYLKTKDADLIVLDMIMDPGIDGFETYRRILEIKPEQKAVIVSGFAETERVAMAQSMGAGTYVRKPYIMAKIGTAIRQELDHK
jgi:CheY-like chemotaxis protein